MRRLHVDEIAKYAPYAETDGTTFSQATVRRNAWLEGYWHALSVEYGESAADKILEQGYEAERELTE